MLCAEAEQSTTVRILERITYRHGAGNSCVVCVHRRVMHRVRNLSAGTSEPGHGVLRMRPELPSSPPLPFPLSFCQFLGFVTV